LDGIIRERQKTKDKRPKKEDGRPKTEENPLLGGVGVGF